MTAITVPGFADFGGAHCETSTLRKLLAHHGVVHDEALLFGLAGGIGFLYWQDRGMDRPFIGGRNGKFPAFVQRMAEATGNPLTVQTTGSPAKARQGLRAELEAGRPAACYGDLYHLPYFAAPRHFGGHAFIVHGVDEAAGVALLSDTVPGSQTIPLAALEQARGSKDRPFPPRHAMLRVDIRTAARPSAATVREAIRFCRDAMVRPPMRKLGLPGLEFLAVQTDRWVAELDAETLCQRLADLYLGLELAGTGGLGFRRLYRSFLDDVADLLPAAVATDALPLFDQVLAAWEELMAALLPDSLGDLGHLRRCMDARSAAVGTPEVGAREAVSTEARRGAVEALRGDRVALAGLPAAVRHVAAAEARFFASLDAL
jgi:hypothetical protein